MPSLSSNRIAPARGSTEARRHARHRTTLCYRSCRRRANLSQECFERSPKDGSLTGAVKLLRLHPSARLLTVVLLMVSWLVATNHCALGMMKQTVAAGAVHAKCHGCPAPAKQAPMDGTQECCQAI